MRVLWLCNIMLPAFAKASGLPYSNREGWLSGSFERIKKEQAFTLGICFPAPDELGRTVKDLDGVRFYGFTENLNTPEVYDHQLEDTFAEILADFKPDVVHIFGTEFPHTLAMVRAFRNPLHTLIGIQGLCSVIADEYMADLPYRVQHHSTFRDFIKKDSLRDQRHKYRVRGHMEEQAIAHTAHITGRTEFDRRETGAINPDALYHPMNETLRSTFYEGNWDRDKVEPYSIFLSQGDYPLKGFHFALMAMPEILKEFPDAHLYVAGNSIIGNVGGKLKERKKYPMPLWITSYGKYLRSLIRNLNLYGHVTMLGKLDEEEMKAQYLKSHVFVCPSILENSPNSMCEAMLLGMPVVAANVGGIPDLLYDGEEGILFTGGHPEELAIGVKTFFYEDELAKMMGENAKARALRTHNADTNYDRLLGIYRSITGAS